MFRYEEQPVALNWAEDHCKPACGTMRRFRHGDASVLARAFGLDACLTPCSPQTLSANVITARASPASRSSPSREGEERRRSSPQLRLPQPAERVEGRASSSTQSAAAVSPVPAAASVDSFAHGATVGATTAVGEATPDALDGSICAPIDDDDELCDELAPARSRCTSAGTLSPSSFKAESAPLTLSSSLKPSSATGCTAAEPIWNSTSSSANSSTSGASPSRRALAVEATALVRPKSESPAVACSGSASVPADDVVPDCVKMRCFTGAVPRAGAEAEVSATMVIWPRASPPIESNSSVSLPLCSTCGSGQLARRQFIAAALWQRAALHTYQRVHRPRHYGDS
eukprot:1299756-Pleurochrysis_carterae.AAC.1